MPSIFKKQNWKFDNHIHTFEACHIPENMIPYLPSWAERFVEKSIMLRIILRLVNPLSRQSMLDWYANYLKFQNMSGFEKVKKHLKNLKEKTGQDWGCTILTVDFEFMQRGKPQKDLRDQLEKAIFIKNSYEVGRIKIYLGVDPRRPDLLELVEEYLPYIDGFKLYCYNGFFPYDERLEKVYKLAETLGLPVLFHCGDVNINYYGGKDIKEILKNSRVPLLPKRSGNKELSTNFCNPLGYEIVAQEHPNLKIIIAHWGGDSIYYRDIITQLLLDYDNIYTDTSFSCSDESKRKFMSSVIKIYPEIINKIYFGTDFPMVETNGGTDECLKLKELLIEQEWEAITHAK